MIIISYGITKSGSTLAFEMTRAILESNGFPQDRLDDGLVGEGSHINFIRTWTDDRLRGLVAAARAARVVVKTHARPDLTPELVLDLIDTGHLKIQVVYRDPRDAVLSMLDQGRHSRRIGSRSFATLWELDDAIAALGRQLPHLREWGSFPSLKLKYEDFAFDPTVGPLMIAQDLGLPVDPAEIWAVVGGRFTQQNVARPERYKTELARDEIAKVERAFPLYLDAVGGEPPPGWFVRPR